MSEKNTSKYITLVIQYALGLSFLYFYCMAWDSCREYYCLSISYCSYVIIF